MKFISLLTQWAFLICVGLLTAGANRMIADPTDDFSFSLVHAPEIAEYRLLSTEKVTEVLKDKIDGLSEKDIPRLASHLMSLCKRYRFDPAFILSLIEVESRFRVRVVSPAGAVGLMQLMPATANHLIKVLGEERSFRLGSGKRVRVPIGSAELMDPFFNLALGVEYLAYLRDHYQWGSPYFLVAAYNVGPAKFDQLLSRKHFKPVNTKKYYESIRKLVPDFRSYKSTGKSNGIASRRLAKQVAKRTERAAHRAQEIHSPAIRRIGLLRESGPWPRS